jgi:hypothetical protein
LIKIRSSKWSPYILITRVAEGAHADAAPVFAKSSFKEDMEPILGRIFAALTGTVV